MDVCRRHFGQQCLQGDFLGDDRRDQQTPLFHAKLDATALFDFRLTGELLGNPQGQTVSPLLNLGLPDVSAK